MAIWYIGAIKALLYITLASSLLAPIVAGERKRRSMIPLMTTAAGVASFIILSVISLYASWTLGTLSIFNGLVTHDAFTSYLVLIAGIASVLALVTAASEAYEWPSYPAFFSLLPLSLFGVFMLAGASNAVAIIASWILLSIASYIIIAIPGDKDSRGSAVRYILIGSIATVLLALWSALHVGSVSAHSREPFELAGYSPTMISFIALVIALSAIGFKTGVVPFHWWLPSVYGRAEGRMVSIVAGIVKLGFIALLSRLLYYSLSAPYVRFGAVDLSWAVAILLAALSVVTMTYGNIAAFSSRGLQQILAYSSIAQIGYILTALSAVAYFASRQPTLAKLALSAVAIHASAYALAKVPLFSLVATKSGSLYRGLVKSNPLAGLSAAILLLSLLGVPPLLGFWGKLYMFLSAVKFSIPLVAIALVNSGLSAVYYAIVVREMLSESHDHSSLPRPYTFSLAVGMMLTIILGLIAPLLYQAISP